MCHRPLKCSDPWTEFSPVGHQLHHAHCVSKSLLLDFGGPCIVTPFEVHEHTERMLGLPPGSITFMGPHDMANDQLWQKFQAREIVERDYWRIRSAEISEMAGLPVMTTKELMAYTFDYHDHEIIRPQMVALVEEARARGMQVGLLTNDMSDFQTREWIDGLDFLKLVDPIVDGSVTGVLKPNRRAYEMALEALGVSAGDVVFVDDQPFNVDGAREVGIPSVWFDVTDVDGSFAAIRNALGW
jgi:putative hydrolase of the HAD superfamily